MQDPNTVPALRAAYTPTRPPQVSTAVVLIAVTLALGLVNSVLLGPYLRQGGHTFFVQVVTVAVVAFLAYKIWVGRNWARITFTVLFALGLAFSVPFLLRFLQLSLIAGSINLTQTLLELVALYLLFTDPGRGWFKTR